MALPLSIGIVTYAGRFESYFKPLIARINSLFPDYDTVVFINGHFDKPKQIQYLKDVTAFLRKYPRIRYVTNEQHQALARGWNWLVLMATCERILVLNDDVSFNAEFRHRLTHLPALPEVFIINGSFSHFVISKNVVRRVGWFDERFLGVGDEDGDYILRLAMRGIELADVPIRSVQNFIAPQEQAGWANLSGVIHGKYAEINRNFFMKKWSLSVLGPVPSDGAFQLSYKGETWTARLNEAPDAMPEFYPMSCLDNTTETDVQRPFGAAIFPRTRSLLSFLYWSARATLGSWLGFLKLISVWRRRIPR